MTPAHALFSLVVSLAAGGDPAAPATPTGPAPAVASAPEPEPAPPPAYNTTPPTLWPPLGPAAPFRLGLSYLHVLGQDGDLADSHARVNAVGLDMAFATSSFMRNHLGLAHQWETNGGVTARGFRVDLISFGFPIPLYGGPVRLDLEPVLTVFRGEVMFVSGAKTNYRIESGFGLQLSATFQHWFIGGELSGDFRYFAGDADQSHSGFSRIFPVHISVGREF